MGGKGRAQKTLVLDADGVVIDPAHRFMVYLKQALSVPPERSSKFFRGVFLE